MAKKQTRLYGKGLFFTVYQLELTVYRPDPHSISNRSSQYIQFHSVSEANFTQPNGESRKERNFF